MKFTVKHYKTPEAVKKVVKLVPPAVPTRLLGAAAQYKTRKRWTGFYLTDDEKAAIRDALKGGKSAKDAAKAAM